VCCGPAPTGFIHCFACRTVARRLGLALTPVLPLYLCPVPGPLYTVLMGYKESPVREARRIFAARLDGLLCGFLECHAGCLSAALGGRIDLVLPVPSTFRPGRSPLAHLPGLSGGAWSATPASWGPTVLERTGAPVGHMRPDAGAFAVRGSERSIVRGARVLMVDDTYVSGARSQSAAATLRLAGARSVLIVAVGRVLRPDRNGGHAAFLARCRDQAGEERCARRVRPRSDGDGQGEAHAGQGL
jgi:hypothetical protein